MYIHPCSARKKTVFYLIKVIFIQKFRNRLDISESGWYGMFTVEGHSLRETH